MSARHYFKCDKIVTLSHDIKKIGYIIGMQVMMTSWVTVSKLKLNSILRNLVNKSKPGFKIGHTSIQDPTLYLFQTILEIMNFLINFRFELDSTSGEVSTMFKTNGVKSPLHFQVIWISMVKNWKCFEWRW